MSPFNDERYDMVFEVDTKDCSLTDEQEAQLRDAVAPLDRVVGRFPNPAMHTTIIKHARSNDFHVKTSLGLSGKTLFTGDRADDFYSPFVRCVRKLVRKVEGYEESMSADPQKAKVEIGTQHEVFPDWQPDADRVRKAADAGDYAAFREALYGYDEPIRKRAGRWVEQYPDIESHVGDSLKLEDVVEEVMLNAFEHYDEAPDEMRFGEWLESWIEPSVQALLRHPIEEGENIAFARTLQENEAEQSRDDT
jgi:ribosome-associated translation inhibitor RaiA